jgi:hypothetical protein
MAELFATVTDETVGVVATVSDPTGSSTDGGASIMISQTSVTTNTIENMADVDLQQLSDGAILIYKNNTAKWTASVNLDAQNMEGGEF